MHIFQICEDEALPIKTIVDIDYCYDVTRTVCAETIEVVPQEVCTYKYVQTTRDTVAKTVVVNFEKKTNVQMVTVCQPHHRPAPYHPAPVYGHPAPVYGHPHHLGNSNLNLQPFLVKLEDLLSKQRQRQRPKGEFHKFSPLPKI